MHQVKSIERKIKEEIAAEAKLLRKAILAICGLGGAGTAFAVNAVHRGFKKFILVDDDRVETRNLRRQVGFGVSDVGRLKVEAARDYILKVQPQARVRTAAAKAQDENALAMLRKADVIVNCFDNNQARLDMQILAARCRIPLVDLGAGQLPSDSGDIVGKGAQFQVYEPGKSPCLLCNGLDTSRILSDTEAAARRRAGYLLGTSVTPPNAMYLNWHIAMFAIEELVKLLKGGTVRHYFLWDEMQAQGQAITFVKNVACPICGANGIEGQRQERKRLNLHRAAGGRRHPSGATRLVVAGPASSLV